MYPQARCRSSIKSTVPVALLSLAVLGFGCRKEEPMDMMDLTMSTQADMRQGDGGGSAMEATIRDINTPGKFMDNAMVKLSGVVLSPVAWADANAGFCNYHIYIAQPANPQTLQDGLRVSYSFRPEAMDMALSDAKCRELGMNFEMSKVKMGQKVELSGRLEIAATRRQVALVNPAALKDMGQSTDVIKPIQIKPEDYVAGMGSTPAKFKEAQGMLVQFLDVKTSGRRTAFPYDFKVQSAAMGTMVATIDTNYLWKFDPMTGLATYTPPMDGTSYSSLTGILTIDFGGTIWPRSEQDLVPKM